MGDNNDGIPPDDKRCKTASGTSGWRCKQWKFQHSNYCKKHYLRIPTNRPKKKPHHIPIKNTDFTEMQEIEVLRKDENLKSAWFKAKILKLSPNTRKGKIKVLIQYDNGVDLLKENVEYSLVRPIPPLQEYKSFQLHQMVDAFYGNGWRKGEIFEVLEGNRYIVHCDNWGEKRNVGIDELRIHQDWVGGEWVKDIDVRNSDIADESEDPKRTTPTTELCTSTTITETNSTPTDRDMGTNDIASESDQRKRKSPRSRPRGGPRKNMQINDTGDVSISTDPKKTTTVRTRSELCKFTKTLETDSTQRVNVPIREGDTLLRNIKMGQVSSAEGMVHSNQVTITPGEAPMDVCAQEEGDLHEDTRQDATDIVTTQLIRLSDGALVHGDPSNSSVQVLQIFPNNAKSLNGDENIKQEREVEEQRNAATEPSAQGDASNLPFTKTYPLWETLENMEVFKSMPQQPHFDSLAEENEFLREGKAIGYMLSFVVAAEKTQNFKFDEPDCTMLETLDALTNLEVFGFDVQPVKDRLEKLLSIKTDLLEYVVERKQVEAEIIKEKLEEKLLESNVVEMTQKMREFEELRVDMMQKWEMIVMKKQVNGSEITALQRSIQETTEEMQEINLRFASVAARPW